MRDPLVLCTICCEQQCLPRRSSPTPSPAPGQPLPLPNPENAMADNTDDGVCLLRLPGCGDLAHPHSLAPRPHGALTSNGVITAVRPRCVCAELDREAIRQALAQRRMSRRDSKGPASPGSPPERPAASAAAAADEEQGEERGGGDEDAMLAKCLDTGAASEIQSQKRLCQPLIASSTPIQPPHPPHLSHCCRHQRVPGRGGGAAVADRHLRAQRRAGLGRAGAAVGLARPAQKKFGSGPTPPTAQPA
jgi:hypothetical protein